MHQALPLSAPLQPAPDPINSCLAVALCTSLYLQDARANLGKAVNNAFLPFTTATHRPPSTLNNPVGIYLRLREEQRQLREANRPHVILSPRE